MAYKLEFTDEALEELETRISSRDTTLAKSTLVAFGRLRDLKEEGASRPVKRQKIKGEDALFAVPQAYGGGHHAVIFFTVKPSGRDELLLGIHVADVMSVAQFDLEVAEARKRL